MKCLVFDIETSGLNCNWHEIMQLSYMLVDTIDWNVIKEVNHFFEYPSQDKIDLESIKINKLTEDFLSKQTISNKNSSLRAFVREVNRCDAVVSHNFGFDSSFIEVFCSQNNIEIIWPSVFDTMMDTVDLCQILGNGDDYKWPKLKELASFLNVKYDDKKLHESTYDTCITFECFKKLCKTKFYDLGADITDSKFHIDDYLAYVTGLDAFVNDWDHTILAGELTYSYLEVRKVVSEDNTISVALYYKEHPFAVVLDRYVHNVCKILNSDGVGYVQLCGTSDESDYKLWAILVGYPPKYKDDNCYSKRKVTKLFKTKYKFCHKSKFYNLSKKYDAKALKRQIRFDLMHPSMVRDEIASLHELLKQNSHT